MAYIPFTYVRISQIAASQMNNSTHKINHSVNLILAPATRVAKSQTQHD